MLYFNLMSLVQPQKALVIIVAAILSFPQSTDAIDANKELMLPSAGLAAGPKKEYYVPYELDVSVTGYINENCKILYSQRDDLAECPLFWVLSLDEDELKRFKRELPKQPILENGVIARPQNVGSDQVTGTGLSISDLQAAGDLKFISWPTTVEKYSHIKAYKYRPHPPNKVKIYIIDSGIAENNQEFSGLNLQWSYTFGATQSRHDDSPHSHGSCVASLVTGKKFGVSKNQELHIIKTAPLVTHAAAHGAWGIALNEIERAGKAGVISIVVWPYASEDPFDPLDSDPQVLPWKWIRILASRISKEGGIIVVPSGNHATAGDKVTNTQPAIMLSKPWARWFPMNTVVAGAVNPDGTLAQFSQHLSPGLPGAGRRMTWAPGEQILCAKKGSSTADQWKEGTSFAAGLVTGMLAYLIASDQYDRTINASEQLIDAWSRPRCTTGCPTSIYNHEDGNQNGMISNTNSTIIAPVDVS